MTGIVYRREIDGLRAIAVLAVVFYHAVALPCAGFVGVDVFFVISGYLITTMLLCEHAETGRNDLFAFYARRVRRIFPAALSVVLTVLYVAKYFLPPAALTRTAESASSASVFVANFFFQTVTGGYFDARAEEMPLLHLWSLSVEEQFYLLWPFCLIVLLSRRPTSLHKVLAGLAIASFLFAEWLMHTNPEAAFYQMPARFWELAAGGLVATAPVRFVVKPWLAACALLCIVLACFVPTKHFPGMGAIPVVVATATLLWTVHQGGELGVTGRFLRSWPMVGFGLISYSLYLWHWPLLAFYRANSIGEGSASVRIALCTVAILLATASYRYIEQPFRHMRWSSARWLAFGAVVSTVMALGACAYGYRVRMDEALLPKDNPFAVRTEDDLPPGWRRCHYQVWSDGPLRKGCETNPGHPASIVLWGDSMAMTWRPLADTLARQSQQSAIDYSRDGCGPFLGYLPIKVFPGDQKCRDWNEKVILQAKRADTVILVGYWRPYFAEDAAAREQALHATLTALADVPHVLILGPTPEMQDTVPRCIRAGNVDACAISRIKFDAGAAEVFANLHAAMGNMPNVQIIDMANFFCNSDTCPPIKDGFSLYWDSHHVSYTAASAYAKYYSKKIR